MSATVLQEFSVDLGESSDSDLEADSRLIPPLSVLTQDSERVPMDTHFQSEFGIPSDIAVPEEDVPYTVFTIHTLFDAAADGDKYKLKGLQNYLQHTSKHLTDWELRDPTNGKTVLMKALLNLRNGQNDTVELLLAIAEETGDLDAFVNAEYEDSFYKGQTALHIAIERRSLHFVKLLVKKGAYVQAKACGKFFQLNTKPGFYFGELPLSLAACTNQLNIVKYLLRNSFQKADITDKDTHGNIVLHALVTIADNSTENTAFVTKMYDEILRRAGRLYPKIKLEEIENNHGLNPIKLAAKTGKIGLLKHMVRREFLDEESIHLSRKFTEWAYGPVYSSLYDLDSLDTYEKNSVLEIIVYGCENPAVLLLFSAVMYASGCAEYVGFLVICLALSWVNLLYFSRGSKNMGIYSVMIQRMIMSDISRFLFVYIVFLFGFSTAVVTLIEEPLSHNNPLENSTEMAACAGCHKHSYNNIYFTTLELFKFTIGMGDLEFTEQYQYKEVFFILLISYIVLTYILLLNMLIALMSETVEKISQESESLWKLQRALTILDLERSLPRWLRKNLRSGVLKELGDGSCKDTRRCFSLEEVNWTKWQTDLGIITKEIGSCDIKPIEEKKPLKERSLVHVVSALRGGEAAKGHTHEVKGS
ncbi:transient receptor potential cation channel subfamily V member 1-like isoform X3 [Sardina pilchardus]|uniref:transient receptor potential cation channel subfamily V member 1-like isoform X3 n=1 Tax=Sardina pilchardus TaxID=27697 RepID=UPI002E1348DC